MARRTPLQRAADRLRCPKCAGGALAPRQAGLECLGCGARFALRGGWLDLLDVLPERLSLGQRVFLISLGGRACARLREGPLATLMNGRTFRDEVDWLLSAIGPLGAGIVLSGAMLDLARERLEREGIENVVLVRGTALDLPLCASDARPLLRALRGGDVRLPVGSRGRTVHQRGTEHRLRAPRRRRPRRVRGLPDLVRLRRVTRA